MITFAKFLELIKIFNANLEHLAFIPLNKNAEIFFQFIANLKHILCNVKDVVGIPKIETGG